MYRYITIVTPNFPSSTHPERGAFVETLSRYWFKSGIKINVIYPESILDKARDLISPSRSRISYQYDVFRPLYMT